MQTNTDLFTPLPVELSTPNGLYQLNETKNYFYNFEVDGFTVPGIDDISPNLMGLSPIPEDPSCSLMVPPLEHLFSPVELAPSNPNFFISNPVVSEEHSPTVKQLSCDLCPEIFFSTQALRLHRRVQHISTKEFRCRKCPASFNFESNLLLHLASHVSSCSTNRQCPECKKVFKRISSFKGHLKTHQTSDRFKCKRCDKEFEMKIFYEKHMAKAHKLGVDGTIEEILSNVGKKTKCRKKFTQSKSKYCCQYCEKKFSKPCLLQRHEICHTGTKPFQCTQCDQGFTQKTSLSRHMLLHRGIKNFKCPKCSYSFSQKNNLIIHIQRTHPIDADADNMFACEFCPCLFTKLSSVNRHQATVHPEKENATDQDCFNKDEDDDNVNVARVMEQLKSFQESMGIMDMQPPSSLKLSPKKPPSPDQQISTKIVIDTLNPKKKETYVEAKEIFYKAHQNIACIKCDKQFKRVHDFLRHNQIHTKEKPYMCVTCHKSFSTNSGLKIHIKIHKSSEEKPARVYACVANECNKRFSSMRSLDIHTQTHTNPISYMCPVCSKVFISKAGFSAHKHIAPDSQLNSIRPLLKAPIQIESNEPEEDVFKSEEYSKRGYQCSVCGLKMLKLSHLRQHEASHTGNKPYQCEICFRSYTTQSSLNLHFKIHTAEKTHICNVCDAKFMTKSLLTRHMISHSDERNFACPYCDERFKTNDNCKNHILIHARSLLASPEPPPRGEKANQYEIEKEHRVDSITQQCIAIVESPEKNLSPKFLQLELVKNCKKHKHKNLTIETMTPRKSSKKSLTRSPKQITKTGHSCMECGKTFFKASDLERHTRTHTKEKPYQCGICSRQFALMSTLVHHMEIHDPDRQTYDCQVCGKKYTSQKVLTVHLRIHTGEKPFHCGVCKKTFRTSGHKISHMNAHHSNRK